MKALIMQPFGLGDVICSLPVAHALHERGYKIHYLCNERTIDFVKSIPLIDKAILFNRDELRIAQKQNAFAYLKYMNALVKGMKREKYDVGLDLSMGKEYSLLLWRAGIKQRFGLDYKGRSHFLTKKRKINCFEERSIREYFWDVLKLFLPDMGLLNPVYPEIRFKIEGQQRGVVVAPGGGATWGENANYKQWPMTHFANLIYAIHTEYDEPIILMGDPSEHALCESIAKISGVNRITLQTASTLVEAADTIHAAKLFVGNDGGLLHMANLLRTPLIGFFGPVSERTYGPLHTGTKQVVLTANVPCRPCYANFKFPACHHEKRCLTEISVQKAVQAAQRILC